MYWQEDGSRPETVGMTAAEQVGRIDEQSERRPELDAIRALVVAGLVFFHASLVFDTRDDYYVKNAATTEATTVSAALGVVWAMPVLFLVAGLGTWHSLRRRGPGGVVRERLLRIGVPLVFGTVVLVPIPQWLRYRGEHPDEHMSYGKFLGRFFDVRPDPADFPFVVDGDWFEVGHLWFLVLLLVFSLLTVAAAWCIPGRVAARSRERAAGAVARSPAAVLALAVPLAAICAGLGMEEGFAGWHRWAYLVFFAAGYALASDVRFRQAMRRAAVPAAAAGLVLFALGMPGFMFAGRDDGDAFTDMNAAAIGARTLFGAAGWCWVVAILGLLDRRGGPGKGGTSEAPDPAVDEDPPRQLAGRPGRLRRAYAYFAPAVLPFYVLHQPVLVVVAYGVVGWDLPGPLKYLVVVTLTFAITLAVQDLLVRRVKAMRVLFGMRV